MGAADADRVDGIAAVLAEQAVQLAADGVPVDRLSAEGGLGHVGKPARAMGDQAAIGCETLGEIGEVRPSDRRCCRQQADGTGDGM